VSDSEYDEEVEAEEEVTDLSDDVVVTKYKLAAEIAQKCLQQAVAMCVDGASVTAVCQASDAAVAEATAAVYNKKNDKGDKVDKGQAFPTCVSVNNCVCHNSPPRDDLATLKAGDLVSVDLGVHIDGFIAVVAHTVCVGGAEPGSRAADVLCAGEKALEAAMRLCSAGKSNQDVSAPMDAAAQAYGCNVVEGVLTHQMKRFVIDGNVVVLNKPSTDFRAEEQEFKTHEVYAVDVVVSTGEGKPKMLDEKQTQVFKADISKKYSLKMQASRKVYAQIKNLPSGGALPFTVRDLDSGDGTLRMKMGLVECLKHELIQPYPVLYEKEGELVAHFKATCLLMPSGVDKVTGLPLQEGTVSEKKIEDEGLLELLATPLKKKKKKNKKKKAAE
jgi:methionyl aminopeptidase